ncbi:thiamine pyrophosphate-binding protein [Pseudonocardia abyssalis]|uniref:Thiamine pyrophosphate-binding protein n=1 Tax=Pseudonocardia abyssalis TaxID=2792008 RepID=A0ABS6UR88_9PSEU|nr:thiamine pyrophosphate-binding protein [Pseudonocardia abyssalis]MBW0116551.1 thiamine pyrophosphate-binding protein [Pseudonocardia abyssalis]MBW0134750.1 thiamine pyrophosphate-binding protein [Pseudonocardia abyssalis]
MSDQVWPAQIAVETMQAHGVRAMFGLTGGHIQALQDFAYRGGIDVHQVRHEQAGAHAADGFARTTRTPGVCFGTAGPGMTNMVTGIYMAHLAQSPMVCLLGGHKLRESGRGSLQEADAEKVLGSVTKWTARCTTPEQTGFYLTKAFRDAMTPPYGPVAIEFPLDTFNFEPGSRAAQVGHSAAVAPALVRPRVAPESARMDEIADLLAAAERPLLVAGDKVHWDRSGPLLAALAERAALPVSLRRMARGAIDESHPLVVPAAVRKPLIRDADLVILLGLDVGYFESFGTWRTGARFVQVSSDPGEFALHLPTSVEVQADTTSALEGLLERLGDGPPAARPDWTGRLTAARAAWRAGLDEEAGQRSAERPIHPRTLAGELSGGLLRDVPVVLDSFTGSSFLSEHLALNAGAQMLDSGYSAAVGHGVGMGIGAAVGTGGPVFVMMGDGGIGIGGGDIETSARYGLPVVYMVYNDGGFCAGLENYCYGKDFSLLGPKARGGFNFTPDIRYDRMYETVGAHVEHVTEPDQIRGAVERSFESGRTAVIDVQASRDVAHPLYDSAYAKEMFWHLPREEMQEPARAQHVDHHYPKFH